MPSLFSIVWIFIVVPWSLCWVSAILASIFVVAFSSLVFSSPASSCFFISAFLASKNSAVEWTCSVGFCSVSGFSNMQLLYSYNFLKESM